MVRWLFLFLFLPGFAFAASPAELDRLRAAFGTSELMTILSEEGMEQAETLRDDMFPGRGGAGWTRVVTAIYAPDRLEAVFARHFDAEMAETDATLLLDFYASENGARVASLEVSARRAIMAEDVEDTARAAWDEMREEGTWRSKQLIEFVELNGLIDRNVTGALNSSLAFYNGLTANEAFEMSEQEILSEVWSRATEIRKDTEGWVFGYMALAYESMSDEDFQHYVNIGTTPEGRALNRAMFAGFEAVFEDVSFALGQATARFSVGDEL